MLWSLFWLTGQRLNVQLFYLAVAWHLFVFCFCFSKDSSSFHFKQIASAGEINSHSIRRNKMLFSYNGREDEACVFTTSQHSTTKSGIQFQTPSNGHLIFALFKNRNKKQNVALHPLAFHDIRNKVALSFELWNKDKQQCSVHQRLCAPVYPKLQMKAVLLSCIEFEKTGGE